MCEGNACLYVLTGGALPGGIIDDRVHSSEWSCMEWPVAARKSTLSSPYSPPLEPGVRGSTKEKAGVTAPALSSGGADKSKLALPARLVEALRTGCIQNFHFA